MNSWVCSRRLYKPALQSSQCCSEMLSTHLGAGKQHGTLRMPGNTSASKCLEISLLSLQPGIHTSAPVFCTETNLEQCRLTVLKVWVAGCNYITIMNKKLAKIQRQMSCTLSRPTERGFSHRSLHNSKEKTLWSKEGRWKLTKFQHPKPCLFKCCSVPTGWNSIPCEWLAQGAKWLVRLLLVLSSWLTSTAWKPSLHRSVLLHTVSTLCPSPFVQNGWKSSIVSSSVIWNLRDCIFNFTRGWRGWRLNIAYSKLAVFHYVCDERVSKTFVICSWKNTLTVNLFLPTSFASFDPSSSSWFRILAEILLLGLIPLSL